MEQHTFHIFDQVKVTISLDDSNIQHQKIRMALIEPVVRTGWTTLDIIPPSSVALANNVQYLDLKNVKFTKKHSNYFLDLWCECSCPRCRTTGQETKAGQLKPKQLHNTTEPHDYLLDPESTISLDFLGVLEKD